MRQTDNRFTPNRKAIFCTSQHKGNTIIPTSICKRAANTVRNSVGYNTFTIQKGFNLCAVNFKDVAKGDTGVNLPDLFPGLGAGTQVDGITYGTGIDNSDYVMFSKGGTDYNKYFLYVNKATKGDHSKDYKWVNTSLAVITDQVKVKNGDAFWFQKWADGALDLTVSGEVEMAAEKDITIQPGFNLIGSYFPAGWNPNAAPYDTEYWKGVGATAGTGIDNADYVMVSKGGTEYNKYLLYVNKATKGDHSKDYKWVNTSLSVVDGSIVNPGQGFWYQHYGDQPMTLKIKRQF